jgi:hypothetical protein
MENLFLKEYFTVLEFPAAEDSDNCHKKTKLIRLGKGHKFFDQ